jgi:hypothetical protein
MKASELRIGNYVQYEGLKSPIKVSIIDTTETSTKTKAKPIPLTEEWLLKFGFVKKGRFYRLGAITVEIHNNLCRICLAGNFIANVEFVHSLQNLYFCLSKKELI